MDVHLSHSAVFTEAPASIMISDVIAMPCLLSRVSASLALLQQLWCALLRRKCKKQQSRRMDAFRQEEDQRRKGRRKKERKEKKTVLFL